MLGIRGEEEEEELVDADDDHSAGWVGRCRGEGGGLCICLTDWPITRIQAKSAVQHDVVHSHGPSRECVLYKLRYIPGWW